MRKILIAFFLLVSIICSGQGVSLSLQPTDLGIGLRYDQFFKDFGIYGSLSKGNYKLNEDCFLKNHYKVGLGAEIPVGSGFISSGITYNKYGENKGISKEALYPMSLEFGGGVFIERFVCSIRMDVVKWEPTIDIGFIL